ncbi:MAG: (Fe-S)-binding protein [Candidatus Lokiarchaeota archaeon]|nr:(Fe-S)-binding protein [Candidatus Lokiarchaeota archaeon]
MNFDYKCVECRACEENCSIFITTGNNSPMEKLKIIDDLQNKIKITDDQIHTIFNCNKCEACQNSCPQQIPLIKLYDWARHEIQSSYGLRNEKQSRLIQNIVLTGNPFGSEESRLKGISLELLNKTKDQEIKRVESKTLLHLGCMLGYRLNSMRDDLLQIFDFLNINYTLLKNENCCGYFVWNTGDHATARKIIGKNSQDFNQFDKIICACAGCYTFFKEHYPNKEKFFHCIEIIDENLTRLKQEGKLHAKPLNNTVDKAILFHDSCHLTRPHKIIDAPRRVMKSIGIKYKNFARHGENSLCCGADGGLRMINPDLAIKIGLERVKEAKKVNSDGIITLCPFCIFNFRDATSEEDAIEVQSLYHHIRNYVELIEKS